MLAFQALQAFLRERSLAELAAVGAVVGELAHLLYFIHGTRTRETLQIIVGHAFSTLVLFSLFISTFGLHNGAVAGVVTSSAYLTALFTSMVVYRLFFHPLRKFPGPFMAKVTKLYGSWLARNYKFEDEVVKLFEKYGDMVRIGPNELICLSLDGSRKSYLECRRGEVFEPMHYKGAPLIIGPLGKEGHRNRRQVWEKAMSTKTTENHERNARIVIREWLEILRQRRGAAINTTLYSSLIPFENMGLMAFSKKFGALASGKAHKMMRLMTVNFGRIARLNNLTWPLVFFAGLGIQGDHTVFENMSVDIVKERRKLGKHYDQDILGAFFEDMDSEKPRSFYDEKSICADAQTVMIGGTDTISSALSFTWSYLARDPKAQRKLRAEIAPLFGRTLPGEFTNNDLSEANAPFLNAVINETIRLRNPAGAGTPRATPPEGMEVDGVFIPGDIMFNVPLHSMHRSDKFWVQPNEWIPERWTDRPELIINRSAFKPFIIGSGNCVGRKLAYIVLRFVIAYTLLEFDVAFAPGEDGVAVERDSVNKIVISAGKLECSFTPAAA